jgi:SAM-dependent methyltransferase
LQLTPASAGPRLQGSALDFGCGVGRLSQALAQHCDRVTGIDISEHMLLLASQHNRHGDRMRYLLNIADDLSLLGDERFDFIYSSITLQHMPPEIQLRYIAELARFLRAPASSITPHSTPASRAVPARPSPPTSGVLAFGIVAKLGGGVGPASKRTICRVLPNRLRYQFHRCRGRLRGDATAGRMQMHAVSMQEVEHVLADAGLRIYEVWDSHAAGEGYGSRTVVASR